MSWVLTSYIVASAVMIPLGGWLSSRIGRRKVMLTSIVVFMVASVLCGLAQSLPELVLFRLLQGIEQLLFGGQQPQQVFRAFGDDKLSLSAAQRIELLEATAPLGD